MPLRTGDGVTTVAGAEVARAVVRVANVARGGVLGVEHPTESDSRR